MTAVAESNVRVSSAQSADGTPIGYCSVGTGPGLIIVGGVLSSAARYRPLAEKLTDTFEVHLMNRRGRAGSGPQGAGHSIEQECDDLLAVIAATGAGMVFGHSFGGLVALETARRRTGLQRVLVYEPCSCSRFVRGGGLQSSPYWKSISASSGSKPRSTVPVPTGFQPSQPAPC